jgi:DNA-binding SARP family transcriptional activator
VTAISSYFLCTFGSPTLLDGAGLPESRLRTKDLALLTYLSVEQRDAYPRGMLAGLFWGDSPEGNARHSLSQAISRLTKIAVGTFETDHDQLRCILALETDVARLRASVSGEGGGDDEISFYRGDFLEGLVLGEGASEFESWCEAKRAELRLSALDILERHGREAEKAGRWERALRIGSRAVEIDRYWERGHRRIMRAWAGLGESTRALRYYEHLARWLNAEIGGALDPETQALADTVRRQSASAPRGDVPQAVLAPSTASVPVEVADGAEGDLFHPEAEPDQARDERRDLAPTESRATSASRTTEVERKAHVRRPLALAAVLLLAATAYFAGRRDNPVEGGLTLNQWSASSSGSALSSECEPGEGEAVVVEEVYHYGVRVRGGRAFTKRWTLQNTGTCTWNNEWRLHYVYSRGDTLSVSRTDIPVMEAVPPNGLYDFSVSMRAPISPGEYEEHWELRDAYGNRVNPSGSATLAARIVVPARRTSACVAGEARASLLFRKYPDIAAKRVRERFTYTWTLFNSGECTWDKAVSIHHAATMAARMSTVDSVPVTRSVSPGQTYTFLVPMQSPRDQGVYNEEWQLRDGNGFTIPIDGAPTIRMRLPVTEAGWLDSVVPVCSRAGVTLRLLDEDYPDNTAVGPGVAFRKTWTVLNAGNCTLDAQYRLRYVSNADGLLSTSQVDVPIDEMVLPWATYTFTVLMRAPREPGTYREDWQLVDQSSKPISISNWKTLYAQVLVPQR